MTNSKIKQRQNSQPGTVVLQQRQLALRASYQSPLPSPQDMAEYEKISPGITQEFLAIAKKEQEASIHHERLIIEGTNISRDKSHQEVTRGQWLAASIIVISIGVGATLVLYGHDVAGSLFAISGLANVLATLITRSRTK